MTGKDYKNCEISFSPDATALDIITENEETFRIPLLSAEMNMIQDWNKDNDIHFVTDLRLLYIRDISTGDMFYPYVKSEEI